MGEKLWFQPDGLNSYSYFIIAVFAAEYALKLYASESRSSFASDPLHILDLVIIVLALFDISKIGYISVLQNQAQLSPILRLVRVLPRVLPRVLLTFFLAGRTAKRMEHEKSIETKPDHPALQVSTFNAAGNISRLKSEDFGQLYASDEPLWADFQQIGEVDLDTIERATRIPPNLIENKLIRESFPRIDHVEGVPTIFLWDSQIKSENSKSDKFKSENLDSDHFKSENSSTETLNIVTNNLLIVCLDHKIVTLSRDKSRLFDKISCDLAERNSRQFINPNDEEFTVKILYHLLWQKLIDYGEIVQRIEQKTIGFEEIPVDKTSPQFLEETFHFKKEIQKIRSNLWHFHQVLHQLTDKKNSSILKIKNIEEFNNLHAESEYLLETAENIKESLISLIELHINTVSYDMKAVDHDGCIRQQVFCDRKIIPIHIHHEVLHLLSVGERSQIVVNLRVIPRWEHINDSFVYWIGQNALELAKLCVAAEFIDRKNTGQLSRLSKFQQIQPATNG